MASRGRKRTDDTTPNRARDIQRAFRARRAAHLESLESRIRELEEENNYFRKLMNMPPANRPLLGKGPTGRGVAKSRSRLNGEANDRMAGSPEPPSDASSTPPIDYALSLPSAMDVYPPLMSGNGEVAHGHSPDVKIANGHSPEIFSDAILPAQHYAESENNAQILPFGYHGEGGWPINPDVPVSATTEVTPTMETARYYVYSPSDQAPINTQPSVVHHPIPVSDRPMNYGHRRSHTEPNSFGSIAAPFSPTHRNCNSSSFIPIPGHELTPSPPPLAIRSTLQCFR